jgi:PAS domain S-box-containing protein
MEYDEVSAASHSLAAMLVQLRDAIKVGPMADQQPTSERVPAKGESTPETENATQLLVELNRTLGQLRGVIEELRARNDELQTLNKELTAANLYLRTRIEEHQQSRRTETEKARRKSHEQLQLVTENAPDFAMLLTDVSGRIATWNVGAERLLGWSSGEVLGKSAAMIFPPETAPSQWHEEMCRAAEFGRAADEGWRVRKSGARFWGSGVLTAVRDPNGELTGFVKILRDETIRKRAETDRLELLDSERHARALAENATRLKDQFMATLSHELRTPLSSILVWAKMLRQNLCDPSEREEGLAVIERSAETQKQLLDDLLDTSRIAAGKVRLNRADTDLHDTVKSVVDEIAPRARESGIQIKADLAKDIGIILADPDRLRQIVSNLLGNAVKFTPSGGKIAINLIKNEAWIELSVADTGRGIDPEFLPNVFTAFTQADASSTRTHGGLGLGLAISKELVELHGGTIHAESLGEEKGATFVVRLPLLGLPGPATRRRGEDKRGKSRDGSSNLPGARVLWVEDEPGTRDALLKLLTKYGANVKAVSNAADAFAAFQEAQPDLVVSDIGLPGEDGYELLQKIRSHELDKGLPATPAVALTAFASNKDRRKARESGFHKHLAKPVTPAALLAALSTLLEEKDRHENGG